MVVYPSEFIPHYPSEFPFEEGGTEIFILTIKQITHDFIFEGRRPLAVHRIGEKVKLTLDNRP